MPQQPLARTRFYASTTQSLMCHPDPPAVIVINDSDQEDCSQFDKSTISLENGIAGILSTDNASGSTSSVTSRRGKSEAVSCDTRFAPTTDTRIRRRSTRSLPHEVIEIDSDTPSVRLQDIALVSHQQIIRSQNGPRW
jgi:hypothetical protein